MAQYVSDTIRANPQIGGKLMGERLPLGINLYDQGAATSPGNVTEAELSFSRDGDLRIMKLEAPEKILITQEHQLSDNSTYTLRYALGEIDDVFFTDEDQPGHIQFLIEFETGQLVGVTGDDETTAATKIWHRRDLNLRLYIDENDYICARGETSSRDNYTRRHTAYLDLKSEYTVEQYLEMIAPGTIFIR
jgi:hypothetical protein